MKELPRGWVEAKFGELLELKYGKALPDKVRDGHGFPVFGSNGIVGNHSVPLTNSETLIVGRKGSVGAVRYSADPCSPIDTTYYVDCLWGMPFRFWLHYLRHLKLQDLNKATAVPGLSREDAYRIPIHLAPLNEQKRITDKLDTLLAQVDACRERLDRVPQILKHFRQTVLAAATSGVLTEEWRSTGSTEWRHVCLADIADIQGGVTKDSKKQQATDEEVPYLRVANVQRGYLDLNEIKTIRIPSSKITSILLEPGDILFNEGGDIDKLGRGWIWEGQISRCSFQNHVFRVRLFSKSDQPKYISWWGNSRGIEYFLRQGKQTTNLASINKTMLGNLPISLPPPDEQHEIVRRIETLFAFADRLEARYTAARAQVENMTPALLDKAFRGELVPQNPNDEPASELLKHIKEQKTNEPEQKRKPRVNTIKNERHMNTKATTTLDELVSVLNQLGGDAMADRLVIESGLSDDIDRFFELLREGRNSLLDVPVGANTPIRRIVDANQ